MKKNKKMLDKIFMWIWILWFIMVESFFFAMFDEKFNKFITTIGTFFIPLMSSIGIILFLIWLFVFKHVDLRILKKMNSDVYKNQNSTLETFNKIASEIDIGIKKQDELEHQELKEKVTQEIEIKTEKENFKKIKDETKIEILKKIQGDINEKKSFKQEIKSSFDSY